MPVFFLAGVGVAHAAPDFTQRDLETAISQFNEHIFKSFHRPPDQRCEQGQAIIDYESWMKSEMGSTSPTPCNTNVVVKGREVLGQQLVLNPRDWINKDEDVQSLLSYSDGILSLKDPRLPKLKAAFIAVLKQPLTFAVQGEPKEDVRCGDKTKPLESCKNLENHVTVSVQLAPELITMLKEIGRATDAEKLRAVVTTDYILTMKEINGAWAVRVADIAKDGKRQVAAALLTNRQLALAK